MVHLFRKYLYKKTSTWTEQIYVFTNIEAEVRCFHFGHFWVIVMQLFTFLLFPDNNYVSLIYIQLNMCNRTASCFRKSCQLCLPSVHFVTTKLHLSTLWCLGHDEDLIISIT